MKGRLLQQRGIALLEAAMLFVLLISMVSAASVAGIYVYRVMKVGSIVDKFVYDDAVNAFKLVTTEEGTVRLDPNEEAIDTYIRTALTGMREEAAATLDVEANGEEADTYYYLEVQRAEVSINPATGVATGFSSSTPESLGTLSVPAEILAKHDLGAAFAARSSMTRSAENNAAFDAVPSGLWGVAGSSSRYLDKVVLIGARVFVSLDDGAGGEVYSWIGMQPFAAAHTVIKLRGEIR